VVIVDGDGKGHAFSVPDGAEVVTFDGAAGPVDACPTISSDAGVVAACRQPQGGRTLLQIWDARTGQQQSIPVAGSVQQADLSDDGSLIGVATLRGTQRGSVEVLSTTDGRPVYSKTGRATAVALSPASGSRFAFASLPSLVDFVDRETTTDLPLVGHTDAVLHLGFGLADTRLVSGSRDGTARIWDTGTGEQVELLAGHRGEVNSVAYNRDGTLVATTSADGDTRVWATDKPIPGRSISSREPDNAPVALLADPAGSGRVLQAGPGRTFELLDPETLDVVANIDLPPGQTPIGAQWAPDGSLVAAGTAGGGSPFADVVAADPSDPGAAQVIAPAGGLTNAVVTSDARVVTISTAGELQAWDGRTGEQTRSFDFDASGGILDVSDAGDRIAVMAPDGKITLLDADSGDVAAEIDGPRPVDQAVGIAAVPAIAFDPSGQLLAEYGADRTVRLWDAQTGESAGVLRGGESYFHAVSFSPDGELVAGGDTSGAYVWSVDSGAVLQHVQHADPGSSPPVLLGDLGITPAFSADGRSLLTMGTIEVSVWDAETGERLFHDPFAKLGGFLDDDRIVTASSSSTDTYPCDLCGDLDGLLAYARDSVTRSLTAAERERYLQD
jgi:WD40 repeat protein